MVDLLYLPLPLFPLHYIAQPALELTMCLKYPSNCNLLASDLPSAGNRCVSGHLPDPQLF